MNVIGKRIGQSTEPASADNNKSFMTYEKSKYIVFISKSWTTTFLSKLTKSGSIDTCLKLLKLVRSNC